MSLDGEIFNLLIRSRQFIAQAIDEAGGCDHDTGICLCADKSLLAEIDDKLVLAFGANLPHRFASASRQRDDKTVRQWLTDGKRAVAAYMDRDTVGLFPGGDA
jgi:hypothetical protein